MSVSYIPAVCPNMEESPSSKFLESLVPGLGPSDLGSPDLPSTMIHDIDLHLECDDDGNFCLPAVADSNNVPSHSVIGQNVNLSVTFPLPKQIEKMSLVFSCTQCDQTFSKHSKLAKHLLQVHDIIKNFQCTVCSFATTSTRLLRRHFVRMHEAKYMGKLPESRYFKPQDQLRSDKMHTDIPVTTYNPTLSKDCQPKSSELDEQSACDIELQNLNEPDNLIGNKNCQLKSSEADEQSACDTELQNLNKPERRTGVNVSSEDRKEHHTVFPCSKCPYRGITQKHLKMHFANIHNHSREIFNCDICDFSCKQKRTFIIHQRMHNGETPYKCDFCQKSFSAMTTLKRHALIHGTDRRHNCPFENCGQVFKYKDILRSHISKVHKKGKGSDLSDESEEPGSTSEADGRSRKTLFACSWKGCGKSFRDNYNLKCHYCLHTGEKPLKCPHCEFRCVQRASLNCHVKKMHFDFK